MSAPSSAAERPTFNRQVDGSIPSERAIKDAVEAEREICAKIVEAVADNLFDEGKLSLRAVKMLLRGDVAVQIRYPDQRKALREPIANETMIGDQLPQSPGAMPETNPAPGKEGKT